MMKFENLKNGAKKKRGRSVSLGDVAFESSVLLARVVRKGHVAVVVAVGDLRAGHLRHAAVERDGTVVRLADLLLYISTCERKRGGGKKRGGERGEKRGREARERSEGEKRGREARERSEGEKRGREARERRRKEGEGSKM